MNWNRTLGILAVLAGVVGTSRADAQSYVAAAPISTPYAPLTGGTPVALADQDEGSTVVTLPFAFPFYGQTYNSVTVHANGMLLLGSTCANAACISNTVIPNSTRSFHSVIAAWWDDLDGAAQGQIHTHSPSATEWVIEYRNWGYFLETSSFNFQIKLHASGLIQFHYGTHSGVGDGATVGIEDPTGANGLSVLSCGAACGASQWPAGMLISIDQPTQPDLHVPVVNLANMANGASALTFSVTPTIRNFGKNPANGFLWKAYLSADKTLDGSDTLAFTASTPVSVPAGGTATPTGNVTINPKPPTGQYYVLVEADHTNVVVEYSETNNVGSTGDFFTQGTDLVAKVISGPALSGPGNQASLNVKYLNQGTDAVPGTMQFKILLSADKTLDGGDFVLFTGTKAVSGGQTLDENLNLTVPANVPGGEFYYLLQLDSAAAVTETNENNNVTASADRVLMQQADLVAEEVEFLDPLTGLPTRIGRIGEPARLRVSIRNTGGADAHNFKVGVAVSTDNNLSLLSDTVIHDEPVTTVAAGQLVTVTISTALPTKDKTNKDFASGNYYLFGIVDSFGQVTEVNNNKSNNSRSVGPIHLRTPAPDYVVSQVNAPAQAAVGEDLPVFRAIKNVGNQPGAAVRYRFFASANDIITPDDVPLAIVGAGGMTSEFGTVTLAVGAEDARTEVLRLPSAMAAGSYHVGCIVDTEGVSAELDEVNNAGSTAENVLVAPSALRVVTTQVSDAMVGRPYLFRLVASGADGAATWVLHPMSTLPEGLSLSADGTLSGTPTRVEVAAFTVSVTSASRTMSAALALRVLPPAAQLEITSTALPPMVNAVGAAYEASLGAAGGVKPYQWRLVSGALPAGIALQAQGMLSGKPAAGVSLGEKPISVEVVDAMGNRAVAALKLRVVEPGALVIKSLTLPDSLVNTEYLADLVAQNLDGSALAKPLAWSVAAGLLPPGLVLRTEQDERGILEGKAMVAGNYPFTVQVEDAKGRTDSIDFMVRVYPTRFVVLAPELPATVRPGDEVSFRFTSAAAGVGQFGLYAGQLPPGLTLAEDGAVTGTVAAENSAGVYNFVVRATDAAGATTLGAFSIEVLDPSTTTGCASAPGGGAWWGLFLLGLMMVPSRLRRWLTPGAATAAALWLVYPSVAAAQSYEVKGPTAAPFVAMQGGTSLTGISTYTGQTLTLPFPFKFYSETHTALTVSMHGYVSLAGDAGETSNQGIPSSQTSTAYPLTFVAPWWDYLTRPTGSAIKYQTTGTAPRRVFTVEWSNLSPSGNTAKFSFQLKLFEGTSQIRFHYGPTAPAAGTASVGLQEKPSSGLASLLCTTPTGGICGPSSFPANQAIDFFLPADLSIGALNVEPVGYAGVPYRTHARLANAGGKPAGAASVRFYLSTDNKLDVADVALGESTPASIAPGDELVVSAVASVPTAVAAGDYFVFAVADPDSALLEQSEANNVVGPIAIKIGPPTMDLTVETVSAPAAATPGQSVQVQRTLRNAGNANAAAAFPATYFLSDNSVVTYSDRVLSTVSIPALASGATDANPDTVVLPTDLKAGQYWLGLCADFDPAASNMAGSTEISEVNNCATAISPVVVSAGTLAVIGTALPGATQQAPYALRLAAAGGDGSYGWSLTGGALPTGMALSPTGDLHGAPQNAGTFGFTATVQSGGGQASENFTLEVTPAGLPLALADQELPAAEFARAYQGRLVAVGGKPPYIWKLDADSRLPAGVAISVDGYLEGRPVEGGEFPFTVEVTDSAGTQAAQQLRLRVVTTSKLQIATTRLPTAVLNKDYSAPLQVVGGKAPYQWSVVRFERISEAPTDGASAPNVALPPELGLAIEETGSETVLRGLPTQAGLFAVMLHVQDSAKTEDLTTITFRVTYEQALALTTTALPDAFIGLPYDVRLSHNAGSQATDISFAVACVQQMKADLQSSECAPGAGDLPAGLTMDANGQLTGTPAPLEGEGPRVYSFLVKVSDSMGREDVRGLSIKLRADGATGAGCSGTALPPSLWALGTVGLLGLRRRRNR